MKYSSFYGTKKRILIACEFSGIVRDAFLEEGHLAMSCDLLPSESPGPHYQGDIFDVINDGWDMMIAFPPCTYLCNSGSRWYRESQEKADALVFVSRLLSAKIPKIALENPRGAISTNIRKPDQIIQPWQFGHTESKLTCLWLKNLPHLQPEKIIPFGNRYQRIIYEPPGNDRWKYRSRTYTGIARAMARQWG